MPNEAKMTQTRGSCELQIRSEMVAIRAFMLLLALLPVMSCSQQMAKQPSVKPLGTSPVFRNGQSAQLPVLGAVPSNFAKMDRKVDSPPVPKAGTNEMPFPLTLQVLERGREQFDINCSVCHGRTGEGDGMIVRRGYSRPPTFHDDRLRSAPLGHFYDVMTNGFGGMPSYANQIEPPDRWAISAYIRALQLSQNATLDDVPAQSRNNLEQ